MSGIRTIEISQTQPLELCKSQTSLKVAWLSLALGRPYFLLTGILDLNETIHKLVSGIVDAR